VNALAAAIGSIADESAIASRPIAALTSRAAKPTATSATESAAASPTESSGTGSARTPAAGASWSARNATGLAFDARSRQSTRGLYPQDGPAQPEIVLAGLQSVAERSVHQKRFIRIPRRLRGSILRRGRSNLVQFVFRRSRRSSEAALLLGTLLCDLSGLSLPEGLQFE